MNKQPCYHSVGILFTATEEFTREDLETLIKGALSVNNVLKETVQVEYAEAEWGDPADLMG